jgi:micrococcal nuclease
MMKPAILLINFVLIFVLNISCTTNRNGITPASYVTVTRVVDGDTFWADNGSIRGIKIRLIGVDAPETSNSGSKVIGYFGEEAKGYLAKLIAGKRVSLDFDVGKKDQYGRTLAYVYLSDGTFVNEELIKNGYAVVMTVPPNVLFAERFLELEREARIKYKGLWKK